MINYKPFWDTLEKKGISTYALIKQGINSATIERLRKNKPITSTTINDLCELLCCQVEDILQYEEDEVLQIAAETIPRDEKIKKVKIKKRVK